MFESLSRGGLNCGNLIAIMFYSERDLWNFWAEVVPGHERDMQTDSHWVMYLALGNRL